MEPAKIEIFKGLAWADIEAWAGAITMSRGKSYQRANRVQELALTPGGAVIAWVMGTQKYATWVDIEHEALTSACSCPYGGACKHAVAVALEYLEQLKQNVPVPVVPEGDRRLALLGRTPEQRIAPGMEEVKAAAGHVSEPSRAGQDAVQAYLTQQTRAQLVDLLEQLARRHPAVRQAIEDRADLSKGAVRRMVAEVSKEIDVLSARPGWTHSWNDEGYVPDYSGVRDRLQALLAGGHADEVVKLGKELLEAGLNQVEMSDDEGETAAEIAQCLDVVFQALARSSLPPAEQMLWTVQADLKDEYELCSGAEVFWDEEHAASDWNTLSDRLKLLLNEQKPVKGEDSYSGNYRRDHLTDWLITALENAGRKEEVIPLCEREAKETGSYVRLVNHLIEAGRREDAERWIGEGIGATQKRWPGIAGQLRDTLRQIREEEKNWPAVAAFRARDFFADPSLKTFQELEKAAGQAGAWPEVRAAAMRYLETGELPQTASKSAGKEDAPQWPLPETGLEETFETRRVHFPQLGTLIDIAIAEKRPDEVVRWYDQKKPGQSGWEYPWFHDGKVAQAIVDAYPDRALGIWKRLAEGEIAQTKPKAYEAAAGFLHQVRRTLKKLGRELEWQSYLTQLRQANARKKRLLEILDGLAERRIINGSEK